MPVYLAVDLRQPLHASVGGVDGVELRSHRDRADLGGDPSAGQREGVDVVVARGEHLHDGEAAQTRVGHVDPADLVGGLDRGDEEQVVVVLPDGVHGVVVEAGREILHQPRLEVVDEQALLVRFVAGALHRAEGQPAAVGRPDGVFVVADHRVALRIVLADVRRLLCLQVVDVDVRVGRDGVGSAGQRLAGVGQLAAVGRPGDFGHVEVGGQRSVPAGLGHDVGAGRRLAAVEPGDEDVTVVALVPVVPVADHQVVVDAGPGVGQVGVDLFGPEVGRVTTLHPPDMSPVGADAEALDVGAAVLVAGDLLGVLSVGRHGPYLHRPAAVGEEVDPAAVGAPLRGEVVRRSVGQPADALVGERLGVDRGHAAVLLHVVVGDGVEQHGAVGRERGGAGAAHLPHHLGGQDARLHLRAREGVVDFERLGTLVASRGAQR